MTENEHQDDAIEGGDAPTEAPQAHNFVADAVGSMVDLFSALTSRGDVRACAREAGLTSKAFAAVGAGWKLQVVPPVAFLNEQLAVVPPEQLAPLRQATTMLDLAGIGVVEAVSAVDGDTWLAFAAAVVAAARGDKSAMASAVGGTLRFGRHPAARQGGDPKQFDAEVYATTLLNRAIEAADELAAPTTPWNWDVGIAAIAGIERAHLGNAAAAFRSLELRPDEWTGQRGAVSMALHTIRTLQLLGVSQTTRRATAHAAFALGAHGLLHGVGRPIKDAATNAFADLMAHFSDTKKGVATAHHARVMSLIAALASDTVVLSALGGPLPLVRILYDMEKRRLEADPNQTPSLTDLLATIAAESSQGYDKTWLAALARSTGGLAIGTSVRLADGTVGVAADPGKTGHPLKPLVMHGKGFANPDAAVQPLPW